MVSEHNSVKLPVYPIIGFKEPIISDPISHYLCFKNTFDRFLIQMTWIKWEHSRDFWIGLSSMPVMWFKVFIFPNDPPPSPFPLNVQRVYGMFIVHTIAPPFAWRVAFVHPVVPGVVLSGSCWSAGFPLENPAPGLWTEEARMEAPVSCFNTEWGFCVVEQCRRGAGTVFHPTAQTDIYVTSHASCFLGFNWIFWGCGEFL